MTIVLDKKINNIHKIEEKYNKSTEVNSTDIVNDYFNLTKNLYFDIEHVEDVFKIILKYNSYELCCSYKRGGNETVCGFIKYLMMDLDKYINYDNLKIIDIYYNPYLYVFLSDYCSLHNLTYTSTSIYNSLYITKSIKTNALLEFKYNDILLINVCNFITILQINNIKRYYFISVCANCNNSSYVTPFIFNINEDKFKLLKDYCDKKMNLNNIPEFEKPYYLDELPKETKE